MKHLIKFGEEKILCINYYPIPIINNEKVNEHWDLIKKDLDNTITDLEEKKLVILNATKINFNLKIQSFEIIDMSLDDNKKYGNIYTIFYNDFELIKKEIEILRKEVSKKQQTFKEFFDCGNF